MHYILMGGTYGCLPDYCQAHTTRLRAVEDAEQLYDLGRARKRELDCAGYLDLGSKYGADYCEIVECDCAEPWIHSDTDEPEDWL